MLRFRSELKNRSQILPHHSVLIQYTALGLLEIFMFIHPLFVVSLVCHWKIISVRTRILYMSEYGRYLEWGRHMEGPLLAKN